MNKVMKKLWLWLPVLVVLILALGWSIYYFDQGFWLDKFQSVNPAGQVLPPSLEQSDLVGTEIQQQIASSVDWTQIKNPFTSEPCYFSALNTCQPVLSRDRFDNTFSFEVLTRQGQQTTAAMQIYGARFLPMSNVLSQEWSKKNLGERYPNLVGETIGKAWEKQLNPGLILTFLMMWQQNLAAELDYLVTNADFELEELVDLLNVAEQIFGNDTLLAQDRLAQQINSLSFTPAGKKLIYASSIYLYRAAERMEQNPQLVVRRNLAKLWSQSGQLEQLYQEVVLQPILNKNLQVEFLATSETGSLNDLYGTSQALNLAVCHNNQAYWCQLQAEPQGVQVPEQRSAAFSSGQEVAFPKATPDPQAPLWRMRCQQFSQFDGFCDSWLPELRLQ